MARPTNKQLEGFLAEVPGAQVTADDLAPFADMLTAFREGTIETLSPIAALDAKATLESALVELKAALAFLDTQALRGLESGDIEAGGMRWYRQMTFVERTNHTKVRDAIVADVVGKLKRPAAATTQAVRAAVEATMEAYISPSTKVKGATLKALGLDRDTIIGKEHKGWEIACSPVEP